MSQDKFIQPESCTGEQRYYLKIAKNDRGSDFQEVRFIGYRPHPAEILIDDGHRVRMVHRYLIYIKLSGDGEND